MSDDTGLYTDQVPPHAPGIDGNELPAADAPAPAPAAPAPAPEPVTTEAPDDGGEAHDG